MGGLSRSARVAWILAGMVAVFALWATLGTSAGVAFFYVVPIGLASWWFGPRAGALAIAACAALYVAGSAVHHVPEFWLALAVRLLAFVAAAAVAVALRERLLSLEHSAEELEAIRAALAPSELPDLSGLDAAAAFVPSELGVSGDFYMLTNGPDGSTLAIVGDVVGHGPQAARLATFIRARFAALAANTSDPGELLTMANAALAERPGRASELVSGICMRLQPERAEVSWACAGHPPPLLLPELEELNWEGSTFLLGAEPTLQFENRAASLEGHEGIVLYTDGATDIRRGREPLGLDGLHRILAPLSGFSARAIVTEVERALLEWADKPIKDDLCLLVLKPDAVQPEPPPI